MKKKFPQKEMKIFLSQIRYPAPEAEETAAAAAATAAAAMVRTLKSRKNLTRRKTNEKTCE